MIRAYGKSYLNDAMNNLGEAVDYAVNECGMNEDDFMASFIFSGIAEQFEHGSPKYVVGMSGVELVWEVFLRTNRTIPLHSGRASFDRSPEYWAGWILAYYQWYTARSFRTIQQYLPLSQIVQKYCPLHEADESKSVEVFEKIISRSSPATRLKTMRKMAKLSQKELAERSDVSLRMIQQYEQRAKSINNASAAHVWKLSRAIGCKMEDILEPPVSMDLENEEN